LIVIPFIITYHGDSILTEWQYHATGLPAIFSDGSSERGNLERQRYNFAGQFFQRPLTCASISAGTRSQLGGGGQEPICGITLW
jgi:hypothetical protein